ncbi:MAG: hypothetical protein Q4D36_01875 [Bacteroidales bacterium]|nr:hypothetical protein [Bacteroidales bacterium]
MWKKSTKKGTGLSLTGLIVVGAEYFLPDNIHVNAFGRKIFRPYNCQ